MGAQESVLSEGSRADGRRPLVFVSGKPTMSQVGGHHSYVRAHALAATALGFSPHIFCAGARAGVQAVPFGVVHTVVVPVWRSPAALQQPPLAGAIADFLAPYPGPHVIHSFAIWSAAGAAASRTLVGAGRRTTPIASAYATRAYEVGAMPGALRSHHGVANRVRYRAWQNWVRLVDDAVEGRGYLSSQVVLVNYESVRRILIDAYGEGLSIRRAPYASSDAFAEFAQTSQLPVPPEIARLAPSQAPLVVAVSRHDPRKGLDILLLALADLAARGVAFRACLVGPGRLLAAHRRLAVELGLGHRVSIPGRVDEVLPYLRQADVFVLPSHNEASGSVSVLEALQIGLPVIASACDGIPEDLTPGVDALLVAPGDSRALSRSLDKALTDSALRAKLAAGALRTYQQRFSARRFTDGLGRIYAELGFVP
jgi:glycosyltransferase involved in cell wall biosynthesis